MKVFGSLSRLVSILFRKDGQDLTLRPNQSTTYTAARDMQLPPGDTAHTLVSATSTQTLTNKSIDADTNTITNIENADIKAGAAIDATKIGAGTVDNTELGYLNGVTSSVQTQLDGKADLVGGNTFTGLNAFNPTSPSGSENILYATHADESQGLFIGTDSGNVFANFFDTDVSIDGGSTFVSASQLEFIQGAGTRYRDSDNSNYVDLAAPAVVTSNRSITLPDASGVLATQSYVDSAINGLSWKSPVRVATTTAGVLLTDFEDGDTVDGVTLATGDRILIKNQVLASENGIYIVAASGAPTRSSDMDSLTPLDEVNGAAVFVLEGTTNADKGFVETAEVTTFPGDDLTFAQFSAVSFPTFTANRAIVSDGSGNLTASATTSTEVGYLSGVTSAIQTQLDAKSYGSEFTWITADGTSKVVTHNFGTKDVAVTVYDQTDDATILVDSVVRTDTNTVTLTASEAPGASSWRVLVNRN